MTQSDPARRAAGGVQDESARDRGAAVARNAQDEAASVAGTAQQEAGHVAEEARHQARNVAEDARRQLRDQAQTQTDHLGEAMESVGKQLHALAEGHPQDAGRVGEFAESIAERVEHLGHRVNELGFDGTVEEVQRFARRRPGAFLAGAAVLGFAATRFAQGAKQAEGSGTATTSTSSARSRSASTGASPGGTGGRSATAELPDPSTGDSETLPPATPASSRTQPIQGGTP